MSWLTKIRDSFGKARESLSAVTAMGRAKRPITDEFWDEFEEALILADVGMPTIQKILDGLKTVQRQEAWKTSDQVVARFRKDVERFLVFEQSALALAPSPAIVLIVGVNGSGKTTTIGKLAAKFSNQGKKVLLAAADTFRAAAADQLHIWAERSGAQLVRGAEGADPAAVVFDGVRAGIARNVDIILIDTAGRLQNKTNLMAELEKMRRVIEREAGAPPAETLLVLDGTTGQNALSQAKLFHAVAPISGVVITKLDSTAKGGVLIGVVDQLEVPIKLVGVGEKAEDLRDFDPLGFVSALFDA